MISEESECIKFCILIGQMHEIDTKLWKRKQATPLVGVGSLSLLQEIFPTQELNRGLLPCRQILYWLRSEEAHV